MTSSTKTRPPPPKLSTPATQPSGPKLTPQFCFNTRVLRDFLRLSRSQLDDTISTNLNSLVRPSRTRPLISPSSSSSSSSIRTPPPPIDHSTCTEFLDRVLFPTWTNRTHILTYCSLVASSPDPDDPNLHEISVENATAAQRKVDERLDPYSSRFFAREPRTQELASLLRNENAVELIVRDRTWRVLTDRCDRGGDGDGDGVVAQRWQDEFDRWTDRQQSRPSSS